VSKIWGVGIKTQQIFSSWGIQTVGDLQNISLERLEKRLGKGGKGLFALCRGIDNREVEPASDAKSISREHTFNTDSSDTQEWLGTLLTLSRDVAYRARKADTKGSTVFLTFRTPDFIRYTRQTTLTQPTALAKIIYETAIRLLEKEKNWLKSLRLIGVGITSFRNPLQTDLFETADRNSPWEASEKAMDKVAERFGRHSIVLAGELWEKKKKKK
jgi:DNA polymerase-4